MGERLLGIDTGGSGTRAVLLENGTVTGLPGGPPINALLTDGFVGQLEKIIRSADATAAGIGVPGLRSPAQAREVGQSLTRRCGIPVRVTGDGQTAQLGAFRGGPGIVVMAGTGSAAVGRDGDHLVRAGGHGFLLGDEGSAYWLGRAAIRAALAWQDGMGGSAALHRAVTTVAGCSLDDLIVKVNTHLAERTVVTLFAPVLTSLAATDPEAGRIADRAADHLVALADAVQRQFGAALPVAGMGGVFDAAVIWDRFVSRTGAVRPLASPAVGAALLAENA